jgi:hypothetical protein
MIIKVFLLSNGWTLYYHKYYQGFDGFVKGLVVKLLPFSNVTKQTPFGESGGDLVER